MKQGTLDPARHDPADPSPWLAVYLDRSLPIHDEAKRAWLVDSASPSRQWLLPIVRPFMRLAIVLVQLAKFVVPRGWRSSRSLHKLIACALARFATPEANWLILRHFHAGAENLAWLNRNLAGGAVPLDALRPRTLADLRDDLFVRHDLNLYNFIIGLNRHLDGRPVGRRDATSLDFGDVTDGGAFPVRLEDMPRGRLNSIDLHTAIELFTPMYALFLTDNDFWRATHSLQFDETIAFYGGTLVGRPEVMSFVNNRHPMVPDITMNGALRLILHGLATEVMHALLVQMKAAQAADRDAVGGSRPA